MLFDPALTACSASTFVPAVSRYALAARSKFVKVTACVSSRAAGATAFQPGTAGTLLERTGTPFSHATKPSSNFSRRSSFVTAAGSGRTNG